MNSRVPLVLALGLVLLVAGVAVYLTTTAEGTLVIQVRDAPGTFTHVLVTFDQVQVHPANVANNSTWLTIPVTNGTVDFMALGNLTQVLGLQKLPAGHYTQIRIVVKAVTATMASGASVNMIVPSGELKTSRSFDLKAGGVTTVTLDFDMARSIHEAGGTWYFTPVIGHVDVD